LRRLINYIYLSTLAFIEAIDISLKEKVDFVLIAGDLFNTALPSIDGIKAVIRELKKLKKANIPVYYIAGSHDFSPSGKTMLDLIAEAELGVDVMQGTVVDDVLKLDFTVDSKTGAKIVGVIGKRGQLDKKLYEKLDKKSLEDEKGFKIFMFHTALDELKPSHLKEMASYSVNFLPSGFDYYAGGHVHIVHKKDVAGYKNLIYPGPVFPANFSEMEKLGVGGFYIYDDGSLIRKEIIVKKSVSVKVDVTDKSPEEAYSLIKEKFDDVKDKIVLIRIEGKLSSGKGSDIDFKSIIEWLYSKGAFFVMKHTTKITSAEFEEVVVDHSNTDEIEDSIIKDNLGQIPNDFSDEFEMTKKLIKSFSSEKHEGEKVSDYEERIKKEADSIIQ